MVVGSSWVVGEKGRRVFRACLWVVVVLLREPVAEHGLLSMAKTPATSAAHTSLPASVILLLSCLASPWISEIKI